MPRIISKVKNVGKVKRKSKILKDELKRIRLFLLISGIALLVIGYFIPLIPKNIKPSVTATKEGEIVISFSQEPVKIDKGFLETQKPSFITKNQKEIVKSAPIRVTVPSLNMDLPVKEANIIKGFWEVFPDTAGWGKGSAYPEDNGNTVIFAHARESLFLPLKKAKIGMIIYVMTKDKWYPYSINEIREVSPNDTQVIAPTNNAILTLYTCSGFSDSKRLIIIADKSVYF